VCADVAKSVPQIGAGLEEHALPSSFFDGVYPTSDWDASSEERSQMTWEI